MSHKYILNRFSKIFTGIVIFGFVCILTNVQASQLSPKPDRIILNLSEDATTSVSVTWRTDTSVSSGTVELQVTPPGRINPEDSKSYQATTTTSKYQNGNESAIHVNQHSYTFTGLVPGQDYIYRVGSEGNWSEWLEFKIPSDKNNALSFIYFGDPQNDIKSQWSRIIRKAYRYNTDCSFMLYAGDIINQGGNDAEWEEWFDAGSYIFSTVPQLLTPGNHDYIGLAIDPHWKTQFSQPQNGPYGLKGTCFFADYKNLRIISIDSAVEYELEDENSYAFKSQKAWLDSVLRTNTKDWVILTTHLPFYSPKESRDNDLLRKHFQPIIEKHGVDMVLTGHDHSYARGMASENQSQKPSVVYIVSVSGPKLYEAGDKNWMQRKGSQMQLFQNISIDNDVLAYEAYTANGQLFDKFLIKKSRKGRKRIIEYKLNTF